MNGKSSKKDGTPTRRKDFNDPDAQNAEQVEVGTQAQKVADDERVAALDLAEESEPGGKANPAELISRGVPNLVDKMKEMHRFGRIDMDAFAGEEDKDDRVGE
jgi:predicted transcriptional regulator